MFIVLRNYLTGEHTMTVLQEVQEAQTQGRAKQQAESPSRLAAVVEAAYILEAVRR
jgi:hypothetical protein